MTSQTATATFNGATFVYEIAGLPVATDGKLTVSTPMTGTPVVLIHAGIADSRMWDDLFAALAESYTVVRYDMRGFGRSVAGAAPPAEGAFAHHEDLAALLLHLGIGRASLVGCSMGSKTALDFALQYPARVERLVLSSPAISGFRYDGPPPRQAAELDAAEEAGDLARVNELEMQLWVDGPHRAPDGVDPRVRALASQMNAVALANEGLGGQERPMSPPAAGRLDEVGAPALIIVGELDVARTLASAEHLAANLPDARREIIPGAAHLPNMERPDLFNRLVLEFLQAPA